MAFKGQRKTIPSARYGPALAVIEATGWTWEEYLAQPWDLVAEFIVRLDKQALASRPKPEKTHGIKRSA